MALTTTRCDFTNPAYWTYDDSLIEIVNDVASLKLQDNTGQTFTEDFADDTGFTYDSSKAEFDSGSVKQKDIVIPDEQCYLPNPTSGADALRFQTSATGTAFNGATTAIVNGKNYLAMLGRTAAYWSYNPANAQLSNSNRVGCIRFKVVTAYGSNNNSNTALVSISAGGDVSRMTLYHESKNSNMRLLFKRQDGDTQSNATFANWTPVDGIEYEFELNIDMPNGRTELFIDGVSQGIAETSLTRSATTEFFIGHPSYQQMHYVRDVQFFDTVQHTSSFEDEIPRTITDFLESKVDLPGFSYPGTGNAQAFTNFASTQTGDVRWILNDLYYNSGWVASDGSYSQASSPADILANIDTLPASDTLDVSAVLGDSITKMEIDSLVVTYTGQIYPTSVPTIAHAPSSRCYMTEFDSPFTEDGTIPSGDGLGYLFLIDGTKTYWDGAAWSASNGTYAQTNDASTVNTNIDTLLGGDRAQVGIEIHFSSADGSSAPDLTYLEVENDAALPDVSMSVKDINGYTYDCNLPLEGVEVYVRPYQAGFNNPGGGAAGVFNVYDYKLIATSVSDGFWSGGVFDNPDGKFWEFKFVLPSGKKKSYYTNFDGQTDVIDFSKLSVRAVED